METNEPRGKLSRRRAIQLGGGSLLAATAVGAADATSASAADIPFPPHLDELRKEIYSQFHREDFHVHLRRINANKNARLIRTYPARVVRNNVRDDGDTEHYSLRPVKGSVMMFSAKRGSELLRQVEQAYVSGDRAALQSLSRVVDADVNRRRVVPASTAVDLLIEAPSYFDLVYGKKLLANNIGLVNGIEFGSMLFPWNGGRLNAADFSIVEYTKPNARPDFETVLVLTEPDLTQIEREALEAVPEDMLGLNIGSTAVSPGWCLVIILVFVAATHLAACGEFHDKLAEVSLPPDVIKQLGGLNSSVELLNRRRQMFESYGM
jgi:hypothetical protein